jgi:histidine triad (HIT) family protein
MHANSECVFCKIVAGTIPAEKIIDDDVCMAFMDVGPLATGHVLLIPKEHFQTLDAVPAKLASLMMRHLPSLVRAVQGATGCQGVNVLQNNGRVAHQVVEHVHVHVIPRNAGDQFNFNWPAGKYQPGQMASVAAAIRKNLI